MSCVYPRGPMWWLAFQDANGIRRCRSTEIPKGSTPKDRERSLLQAEALLREIERQVAEERAAEANGVMTLAKYAGAWVASRRRRKITTAKDDEARLRDHVLCALGARPLAEVARKDVRVLFRAMMDAAELAPRTIRHVYGTLHTLFEHAVADELVAATPCTLKVELGELPEKLDKDPLWRAQAIYSRAEARQLCTSSEVDAWRRVLYAILFFAGLRIGEALGRRWGHYDRERRPLGALSVHSAWSTNDREERGTKTRRPREVPVHPELAAVLADWRLRGWAEHVGRPPTDYDWIIPPSPRRQGSPSAPWGAHGRPRGSKGVLKRLRADCEALGFPASRRTHDTRSTFITGARSDGAVDSMLKWVSHGPGKKTILDDYTKPPWEVLCAQVLKIEFTLGPGEVVPLHHEVAPT